ncbi:MAG: hypothetical protein RID23_13515 [Roseovarius sp.]
MSFLSRIFGKAIQPTLRVFDALGFAAVPVVQFALGRKMTDVETTNFLIYSAFGIILLRFFLAPWLVWREDQKTIAEIKEQNALLLEKTAYRRLSDRQSNTLTTILKRGVSGRVNVGVEGGVVDAEAYASDIYNAFLAAENWDVTITKTYRGQPIRGLVLLVSDPYNLSIEEDAVKLALEQAEIEFRIEKMYVPKDPRTDVELLVGDKPNALRVMMS